MICIGREALRMLLKRHDITVQRTKTWKESTDPDPDFDAQARERTGPPVPTGNPANLCGHGTRQFRLDQGGGG